MKHLAIIGILLALIGIIAFQVISTNAVYSPAAASNTSFHLEDFVLDDISVPVLIFDVESGEILFVKDGDKVLPLASVTKLLSAAVFYSDVDLLATTSITAYDLEAHGVSGEFTLGEVRTNHELIFAALLASSNDASAAMLRLDKQLLVGMNDSFTSESVRFVDASGLSSLNVGTVYDVLEMYRYVEDKATHILDITRLGAYYASIGGWLNNNPFILDNSYRGGKHGFLPGSGYTAISVFEEVLKNGVRREVGYIILGSNDLDGDMAKLRSSVAETVRFE